jgi:hypothetical protein
MSAEFDLETEEGGFVEIEQSPDHINLLASNVSGDVELRLTESEKNKLGRALLAAEVGR